MNKQATFFFDVGSPTSFLAHRALPEIARETGATITWVPVLLGGVFQATGNSAPTNVAAKAEWLKKDLAAWAKRRGVIFNYNPFFPINTLTLQRGAVAYQDTTLFERYVEVVFSAMWEHPKNLGDTNVLDATLMNAGFDLSEFRQNVTSTTVKDRLKSNTAQAVGAGVFGCPTVQFGDEIFFGQDRLDFLRAALKA